MTTSDEERAYFDRQYSKFLHLPDNALRVEPTLLERDINNPKQPCYERWRLYLATLEELAREPLQGVSVLDYGCGPADFGLWMACRGAHVTLLDLSPAAIELGVKRAEVSGLTVRGFAADASRLDMFRTGEFDIVFACAALHHTMKYEGAVEELARVMRPGARLVLCETWGGNPILNLVRRAHWKLTGAGGDDGEDILMCRKQLKLLAPHFTQITVKPLNLLAMSKRMLRGKFERLWVRRLLGGLELMDRVLLSAIPLLREWCGEAVITAVRK